VFVRSIDSTLRAFPSPTLLRGCVVQCLGKVLPRACKHLISVLRMKSMVCFNMSIVSPGYRTTTDMATDMPTSFAHFMAVAFYSTVVPFLWRLAFFGCLIRL
jgi:hypothetical protein